MLNQKIGAHGHLVITKNGKKVFEGTNRITTQGLAWLADRIEGTASAISHMAIGTGWTVEDPSLTSLEAQSDPRETVTVSTGVDYIRFISTFTGRTGEMDEAGLFTGLTGASMMSRLQIGPVTVVSGDSLMYTWTITFSSI